MDTNTSVYNQSMYTTENLVKTAFECSENFRKAVHHELLAPLEHHVAELQYSNYNFEQDLGVKTKQVYQLEEENRCLQADLDIRTQDTYRLRRQRDEAEARLSALAARSNEPPTLSAPLIAFWGDLAQWPQFVERLHRRIEDNPLLYKSDRQKCQLLMTFMIGPAKEWADLFVNAPELDNFQVMVAKATLAWGDSGKEARTRAQLLSTRLEAITVQDLFNFHQRFEELAARISWSEPAILQCYKQGLPWSLFSLLKEAGVANKMSAVQAFVIETVKEMENKIVG